MKPFFSLITLALIMIVLFTGCEIHKVHQPLHSTSINEAKQKGTYVKSYKPAVISINDSIQFEIKEAWCEKTYYYDDLDKNGKLEKNSRVQTYGLVFITTEPLEKKYEGYGRTWLIENCGFGLEEQENVCYCRKIEPFKETQVLGDTVTLTIVYYKPYVNEDGYSIIRKVDTFRLYKNTCW